MSLIVHTLNEAAQMLEAGNAAERATGEKLRQLANNAEDAGVADLLKVEALEIRSMPRLDEDPVAFMAQMADRSRNAYMARQLLAQFLRSTGFGH